MNMRFTFQVAAYRRDEQNPTENTEVLHLAATGSQETRARRRVLDELHNRGVFVKSVELLATEQAK